MAADRMLRVEMVFDAWADPDKFGRWFGPEGMNIPEHQIDPREGGAWRAVMQSPEGSRHIVAGVYKVIDRPNRLEFTWFWQQDDGSAGHETNVAVSFAAKDGGTLITLIHTRFESDEARDSHLGGWNSTLNCLEALLA